MALEVRREAIPPLKGDAAMVTISLKSSIIISSWVQLALSHCPLNFLQIRFEMKTSLWKFIIATALGKITFWSILKYLWCMRIWITICMTMQCLIKLLPCCLPDQVWVQSLPLSHDDCCHDVSWQPSTCISLSSPLLKHGSALWEHWSVGVRCEDCEASKYAELLWGLEIGETLGQWE